MTPKPLADRNTMGYAWTASERFGTGCKSLVRRLLTLPRGRNAPIVVYVLLGAIILSFINPPTFSPALELGNRSPKILRGEIWRFFTSMFVHADFIHLLLNCISLLIFGLKVERNLGHWRFVTIFVLSGILGSLSSFLIGRPMVSIGASGGIFGVIAASLVFYYRFRNELGQSGQKELGYAAGTVLANIVNGLIEPNVDNWAHLGGLAAGAALSWLMIAQAIRAGKLFTPEEPLVLDRQRQLTMRLASIFLFVDFVLGFGLLLIQIAYHEYIARNGVLDLIQWSLLPVLKFVAALELWRGNTRINWLLLPVVMCDTCLVAVGVVLDLLHAARPSLSLLYILAKSHRLLLNASVIILLTGRANRVRRRICLGIFVAGYVLIELLFMHMVMFQHIWPYI